MKAIILAAGEGKRMRPLTLKTPKPLLKVNGKPIIDYVFESLPTEINEVVVVIKYRGEAIRSHLGQSKNGVRVTYVEGSDKGTAYSFLAAREHLKSRFLFIYGDEIPHPLNVKNCLARNLSILVFETNNPGSNGIVSLRKDGTIDKIVEKPKKAKTNIAADGVMVLNQDILNYVPTKTLGEYYFSELVGKFVKNNFVYPVMAQNFVGDLTTPGDLYRVKQIIKKWEK